MSSYSPISLDNTASKAIVIRELISAPGIIPYGRSLSTFQVLRAIDKQLLTGLRKKTGFSFTKCNDAMKLHNNDLEKAEEWLYKQAEKEGWAKAKKLEGRSTSQGLVGVLSAQNHVALVEVRLCTVNHQSRN